MKEKETMYTGTRAWCNIIYCMSFTIYEYQPFNSFTACQAIYIFFKYGSVKRSISAHRCFYAMLRTEDLTFGLKDN